MAVLITCSRNSFSPVITRMRKRAVFQAQIRSTKLTMIASVALTELSVALAFALSSLIFVVFIFNTRSPKSLWRDSPPLFCLFVAICCWATSSAFISVNWILFNADAIGPSSRNVTLLHFAAIAGMCIRRFHNCASIGVFAQRICFLAFPLTSTKILNRCIVAFIALAPLTIDAAFIYVNFATFNSNIPPVSKNCRSFNCLSTYKDALKQFGNGLELCFSAITVILGTCLMITYKRFRNQFHTSRDARINRFTRYLFYLQLIFEVLPSLSDVVITNTVGVPLGAYIGPYGLLGGSVDVFTTTLTFYLMTRKPSDSVRPSEVRRAAYI